MSNTQPKSNFFLFKILNPTSKLKRDEPGMLTRVLWIAALIFLIIDILVVIFYFKTIKRIDTILNDEFTQAVINCIDESTRTHQEYSKKTRDAINQENLGIRTTVADLIYYGKKIDATQVPKMVSPELLQLKDYLTSIEKNDSDKKVKLIKAIELFNKLEKSILSDLEEIKPIESFGDNIGKVELSLQSLVKSIRTSLENFLHNLLDVAKVQNTHQDKLANELDVLLEEFSRVHSYIYKNGKYQPLNRLHKLNFHEFENDYVPFAGIVQEKYFGAKLTYTSPAEIKIPSLYYCTIQAYIAAHSSFSVVFQLVDLKENGEEEVVSETDEMYGGFKEPISLNEIKVVDIKIGKHNFYLRALSQSLSSQIRMKDMAFECISYRNFH